MIRLVFQKLATIKNPKTYVLGGAMTEKGENITSSHHFTFNAKPGRLLYILLKYIYAKY